MNFHRTKRLRPSGNSGVVPIIVACLLSWAGPVLADAEEEAAWIGGLHQKVEKILQGPAQSESDRAENLESLILEGFDLPALGAFALGRHVKEAEPGQIERFQELFGQYALRNYTHYLIGAGDRPFFVDRGRQIGDDETLVKTRLGLADDEDLEVVWRVRSEEGDHKIVDLFVEGVSMAITLRQEFGAVISAGGMETLLDSLGEEPVNEAQFKSTGKATQFLLQSQMGPFGTLSTTPR